VKTKLKEAVLELEGLDLYQQNILLMERNKLDSDMHAREAMDLISAFRNTGNASLLKSIQFHRELAKHHRAEAEKFHSAAYEVADHYDLFKSIRQSSLQHVHKGPKGNKMHMKRSKLPRGRRRKGAARHTVK
jgi:hypothetical protein